MESSINTAWDVVQRFRVPDLQALLEYARLPRQGYKRDLLSRCKVLLTSKWSPQLATKIDEINQARMNSSRNFSWTRHYTVNLPNTQPVVVVTAAPAAVVASPSATDENLPPANHVQFVHLPFFETIRNIECVNMSVNRKAFNPLYFRLNESDINLILKGTARVFLRLAPTIVNQRQHDVIPCYLTVQCNGQVVINNNVGRVVNASAHALMFPHDLTAQIVPKSQAINSLTYCWFHLPQHMGLRNLPLAYTLAIQLVRCVPLDDLCTKILQRPMPVTKLEETKNGRFDVDDLGLMTTRHRVSLLCPITQRMIVQPVKSRLCSHVACFDLQPFLQMNQRRSQWMCPFCKKPAAYDTLHLDSAFKKILDNAPANCTTVEINSSANGSWEDCHYIVDHLKEEKSDPDSSYASKEKDGDEDCVVLSSESEDDDDDDYQDGDDEGSPSQVPTALFTPPFNDVSALSYSIAPDLPEEALWDDIARFTYDYIANEEAQQQRRRKRTRSPDSSISKRHRSSTTSEIAIITLDSSDNESENHS